MYKIINPFINLANASLTSWSRFILAAGDGEENKVNVLWQTSLENQARFVREYTEELLATLAQTRVLMTDHVEKVHKSSERVATQLAHSSVRAVAIATQARREKRERRVFPLPMPMSSERRAAYKGDRRLRLPPSSHHAAL